MAAITVVKARACSPPGYEVNDTCELADDVTAGDLLVLSGTVSGGLPVMEKAPTTALEPDGIALQDGYDGQRGFSYGIQGEMDGFSGLTPGALLYPSGTTAGVIDDTKPTGAANRIKAVTTTRIRYNLL